MKKTLYLVLSLLIVLSVSTTSCTDEFLDVIPTGVVIPNTVDHYDQMLNGVYTSAVGQAELYMDPDVFIESASSSYLWTEKQYIGETADDYYMIHFRNIYVANIILQNVDAAPLGGAIESTRVKVKRDALIERALNYFRLVNTYSPAYSENTKSAVAVPIQLTPDIEALTPSSTVEEVYTQIIADLNAALDMVDDNRPAGFTARGSNLAVKALLAKVYMYMGDFTNAKKYTEAALSDYSTLHDYTAYADDSDFPAYNYLDPDVILVRGGLCGGYYFSLCFSKDLTALYDTENDIRFKFFAIEDTFYGVPTAEGIYEHNNNRETNPICGTPDLYLMRAELNALEGNLEDAMKDIDLLRKHRILPAGYTAFYPDNMPADKDEALRIISEERRRETAMSGENLWTQKRYHAQGRTVPTFTRVDLEGNVLATLEPGSSGYWVGFAESLMRKNPNIKWNK